MVLEILLVFTILLCIQRGQSAFDCKNVGNGYFADPDDVACQRYILCLLGYKVFEHKCPELDVFSPETSECTDAANYHCDKIEICKENGFFPDPLSRDCTDYVQCVLIDGTFHEAILSCPPRTFFNPITSLCDYDYECSTSQCYEDGFIANKDSKDCTTYIQCVLVSGVFYETYYTCPYGTYYNPDTTLCEDSYKCPKRQCYKEGYFPDITTRNCKNYVECVFIDGLFQETVYSCPSSTLFNPESTMCEFDYKCLGSQTCDCVCTK